MTIEKLREIYKLKNIVRYNTKRRLKDESVAEHSFYVALISLLLCKEYHLSNKITTDAVIKALLHDMPEIELNDITHDTKEKLNLAPLLKVYENKYYKREFPEYLSLMTNDKNISSTIVDIADAMSVLQYSDNEMSLGNKDKTMNSIITECQMRIDKNTIKLKKQIERRNNYVKSKTITKN